MKLNRLTTIILGFTLLFSFLASCRKQDEPYRDFYQQAIQYKYPQRAQLLKASGGFYSATLSWIRPTDKSVKNAKIFWNNGADSLTVDPNDSSLLDADTIRVEISPLEEKLYNFFVYTYDGENNRSKPSETSASVIGDKYVSSLIERTAPRLFAVGSHCVLKWKVQSLAYEFTEVSYPSTSGPKTIQVLPSETLTDITDYDATSSDSFAFRSAFAVAGMADLIRKPWQEVDFEYKGHDIHTVSAEDIGKILGSDGGVYRTTLEAADYFGAAASGMIAYVGDLNGDDGMSSYSGSFSHGLVFALSNKDGTDRTWAASVEQARNCNVVRPQEASEWFMPTAFQFMRMYEACGGDTFKTDDISSWETYTNFAWGSFNDKLVSCGGEGQTWGAYWTRTQGLKSDEVWFYYMASGRRQFVSVGNLATRGASLRPVFAF